MPVMLPITLWAARSSSTWCPTVTTSCLQALADQLRSFGAAVLVEPPVAEDRRLDLLVTVGAHRWALDVSVVNPAMRSHIAAGPGGAAAQVEREKRAKYSGDARRLGAELRPFVLDCYGAFAGQARQFLREASTRLSALYGQHRTVVHTRLVNAVAVALQKGNAACKFHAAAYAHDPAAGRVGRVAPRR